MTDLEEAFRRLDRFIKRRMRQANIPGVAVGVTDRERLLRISTYGFSDLARKIRVTPDTLFEIGSISKSFTSILLLQEREAGRLDLQAPVMRYLPWFSARSKYGPIKVHHLMSHTAGIIMGTDFTTEARYETWALRETETGSPPGEHFHYSNLGYKALGVLLETLTGRSVADLLRSRILGPLGMTSTDPVITSETRKRLAVGYLDWYDDRPSHPSRPLVPATWLEADTADGSIASTPADMAVYLRMLLRRGEGPQGRILSEESFGLLTQHVIEPDDGAHSGFYGYGLMMSEDGGHAMIGHSGGMVGYVSSILVDMDAGLGVVVLTNAMREASEMGQIAMRLLRAAQEGKRLPVPRIPDPTKVKNASDYAGTFRAGEKTLVVELEGGHLLLRTGADRVILESRGGEQFYANHPDFDRFLLTFRREGGHVVEAFHGPDWYVKDGYAGTTTFELPDAWRTHVGHYRSHNPWLTNFRVVLRKGQLVLVRPEGAEEILVPLGDGVFRVGEDEHSPERVRFDTTIDGKAVHANLSCCDYFRTPTS